MVLLFQAVTPLCLGHGNVAVRRCVYCGLCFARTTVTMMMTCACPVRVCDVCSGPSVVNAGTAPAGYITRLWIATRGSCGSLDVLTWVAATWRGRLGVGHATGGVSVRGCMSLDSATKTGKYQVGNSNYAMPVSHACPHRGSLPGQQVSAREGRHRRLGKLVRVVACVPMT